MALPSQQMRLPVRTHRRVSTAVQAKLTTKTPAAKTTKGGTTPVRTSSPGPALTRKVSTGKQNLGGKGTLKQLSGEPKEKTDRAFKLDQFYSFITGFPFPLGPTFTRNTVRYEVERDTMWVFEQTQALEIFNVYTPVRMTVIKLKSRGLWVHAPVAPTEECIRLLKELDAPVEYIVLPTYAYEHKAFVGPFSRKFPKAKVYIAPYQWSFPLNLPPQFFGIFPAGELVSDDPNVPWADEIEQKVFVSPALGVGDYVRYSEVAFFHKRTRTLMVTDAVVYVDDTPPEVIPTPALLEIARDNLLNRSIAGERTREEVRQIAKTGPVEDTLENRKQGWRRMALLVLYFGPSNLLEPEASFDAISKRLIVGPVVETLVFNKVPAAVRSWVDDITSSWNFRQIIPCHFSAPIKAGPAEFKRAFTFAYELLEEEEQGQQQHSQQQEGAQGSSVSLNGGSQGQGLAHQGPLGFLGSIFSGFSGRQTGTPAKLTRPVVFPEADMRTLNTLNSALLKFGVVKARADRDVSSQPYKDTDQQ